jgi:uncharacterized Zn-finger protein
MHYHLKKHEGNLPFACTLCDKQFLHATTLELHRKAQHDKEEERMFKCPVSGCTFKGTLTRSNLIVHYVRKHKKEEAAKKAEAKKAFAAKAAAFAAPAPQ